MPQRLDGRYEILKPLGSGGFGKTYLARDLRIPGTPYCVVKQLHCVSHKPEDRQLAQELFQREAESLAKLGHHDQIPRLLAYFTENEEFYLVEDFIDGRSLEDEIRPGQPWPEAAVIDLMQSILEILAFVHHQGVIHRDIKPSNLIRRSNDGKIVLIDFGAIKQIEQAQVNGAEFTGTQIGTAGYMPPEQAQGKPRPNSDIYGVGILGISALTGHPAAGLPDDPQTGEITWQHLIQVSPGVAQILSGMVRYYFQHRYQTVEAVQQAFQGLSSSPQLAVSAASPLPPVSSPPAPAASSVTASSPVIPKTRKAPWILGIALAIFIPVLGGIASLLFNSRTSFTSPADSSNAEVDQPCRATVVGNIRSERTAYRGNGNILQTGQGQSFEIGTQETRGGWIQIKLSSGQTAWTHLDVVANESELESCLRQKNIDLQLVSDIPPPPRPQPRPVTPQPTSPAPTTPPVTSPDDNDVDAPDTPTQAPDASDSPTPGENNGAENSGSTDSSNSNNPPSIEESQPAEETSTPSSTSTPPPENRPTTPPSEDSES